MNRIGFASLPLLAVLLILPAAAVHAQAAPPQESSEALAVVDALFAAMAVHDVAAARQALLPGANLVVVLADGRVRVMDDAGFLEALGKDKAPWQERIWDARVTVQDGLAQVWAPYDFHHDGKFSHCGVESFALVRDAAGAWRIANVSYTMRHEGCTAPAIP
jgi:hypothetical protein